VAQVAEHLLASVRPWVQTLALYPTTKKRSSA
jgi:hypothetical protein